MSTVFQLHAVAPDRTKSNAVVCYEFHTKEDVIRLVWRDDQWKWTRPFETYDEYGEKDPIANQKTKAHIELRVHPTQFRLDALPLGKESMVSTLTKKGTYVESKMGALPVPTDQDASWWIKPNDETTGVAFCVRVYHRMATRPPQFMFTGHTSWSWVSTAIVPWDALFRKGTCLVVDTFSLSDERSNVGERGFEQLVVSSTSFHQSRLSHEEKSDRFLHTLVAPEDKDRLRETTTRILNTPAWKALGAVIQVTENFTIPENDELRKLSFVNGNGSKNAKNTAVGNFGIAPDGVQFDMQGPQRLEDVPWKFYGVSMQSWFDYETPAATCEWLLAALRQVQELHGYNTSFADDVALLKKWTKPPAKDVYNRLRRRLTDVLRVCTMHSVSRPYIPDHVQCTDGSWVLSDVFTSGLTLPGDCEDGAHAAYHLYMTILFGQHDHAELKLLRDCAAMAGVPLGAIGTTYDPIEGKDGEPHCFGIVLPFPTYVRAMFGASKYEDAMLVFKQRFGFAYPPHLHNHIKVMETTFFNTAGYEHHTFGPFEEDVNEWLLDMGEDLIAWSNMCKLHQNTMSSPFQNYVSRVYTSYNRLMFPDWFPTSVEHAQASMYTMSFVIWDEQKKVYGASFKDLFGEKPKEFTFRTVLSMPKATYEAERELLGVIRRPVVPLVVLTQDPYKPYEDRHRAYELHSGAITCKKPHFVVFVYDLTFVYPDGKTWEQKVSALCSRLNSNMRYTIRPYGFAHALVLYI